MFRCARCPDPSPPTTFTFRRRPSILRTRTGTAHPQRRRGSPRPRRLVALTGERGAPEAWPPIGERDGAPIHAATSRTSPLPMSEAQRSNAAPMQLRHARHACACAGAVGWKARGPRTTPTPQKVAPHGTPTFHACPLPESVTTAATTTTATATIATTTTTTNSSAGSPLVERVAGRGLGSVLDCRDGRSKLPNYHCMSRASTAVSARRAVIPQPDDNDRDDLPPADNPWSFFSTPL